MASDPYSVDAIAERLLAASDSVRSIPPLTSEMSDFGLAQAYDVSAALMRMRRRRGERPVGWKIGFTNRTIWEEYGVHAPIWGPVYDSTARGIAAGPCRLAPFVEPRIEPEIVLRFSHAPDPRMDERTLLGCIDGIAHGFEIVQSLFPGWSFRAPDTVAAFGLHGCLYHGPFSPLVAVDAERWLAALSSFTIELTRDGVVQDTGAATNVLGGPLSAALHFIRSLDALNPFGRGIEPGDIVTTGTVTRAFPVEPGETWRTALDGVPLSGIRLAFK